MLPPSKAIFYLTLGMLFLNSCGDFPISNSSIEIEPDGWYAIDVASFDWDIVDLDLKYDALIDIRHNSDYPYSNLYLFLDFTFPNGNQRRDTLACELADERGRWYGSGMGDIIDHRVSFQENFEFPIQGKYRLKVAHGMRQDPLMGVTDIGFRLEKSQMSQ
jgi:gliding motility-associated lipoprotein GldH